MNLLSCFSSWQFSFEASLFIPLLIHFHQHQTISSKTGSIFHWTPAWQITNYKSKIEAVLSNMVANGHMWLFQFKLIENQIYWRFSSSVVPATFQPLNRHKRLVATTVVRGMCPWLQWKKDSAALERITFWLLAFERSLQSFIKTELLMDHRILQTICFWYMNLVKVCLL